MPGHKGAEPFDITEIDGAGDLFSKSGIIRESERIASSLFGHPVYYSTEGSSLAIRAMAYLSTRGGSKTVVAARNAHRSFISAAILLGLEVKWIFPKDGAGYMSCPIGAEDVKEALDRSPDAPFVYLTSPDYLGNTADVRSIAKVCHERGTALLVDCAHGAYLGFLEDSLDPIALGADMCAASAHKTLPVLTGGAYLSLSEEAEAKYSDTVKEALELFASSSPSYLIMRSLDLANRYLEGYPERLSAFAEKAGALKRDLERAGYSLVGDEPLKITIKTKPYGYTGDGLAALVSARGVIPEFHDPDYLGFMLTPENTGEELGRLKRALLGTAPKEAIAKLPPRLTPPSVATLPRDAALAPCEVIEAKDAEGRIMASSAASCPPAVPIVVPGEVISKGAVDAFEYYGKDKVTVVKK